MRLYRCFHDGDLRAGESIVLAREEAHHLSTVRRTGEGARVRVLNGRGMEAEGSLVDGKAVEIAAIVRDEPRPQPGIELALALTRTDAFEDAIERGIELGMTAFRPLEAEHCVVRLDAKKAAARADRWHRMAIERLKQCERLWLPRIEAPAAPARAIAAISAEQCLPVFLSERSAAPPLLELAREHAGRSLCLLVGPEGGWSAGERDEAVAAGAVEASLGSAILRAETAALAGLATVLALRSAGAR